jgi:hypothetical protein
MKNLSQEKKEATSQGGHAKAVEVICMILLYILDKSCRVNKSKGPTNKRKKLTYVFALELL